MRESWKAVDMCGWNTECEFGCKGGGRQYSLYVSWNEPAEYVEFSVLSILSSIDDDDDRGEHEFILRTPGCYHRLYIEEVHRMRGAQASRSVEVSWKKSHPFPAWGSL
jgi:hypothetical protein